MQRAGTGFTAAVPADYTGSPYPLQYYFEVRDSQGRCRLLPGLPKNAYDLTLTSCHPLGSDTHRIVLRLTLAKVTPIHRSTKGSSA